MQNLKVIYEDNHIIVVEKTPNIPSQSDKTGVIVMLTLVKQYIKEIALEWKDKIDEKLFDALMRRTI